MLDLGYLGVFIGNCKISVNGFVFLGLVLYIMMVRRLVSVFKGSGVSFVYIWWFF